MDENPYKAPAEQAEPTGHDDSAAASRTRLKWVLKTTFLALCTYALMYAWQATNGKKPQSARLAALVLITVFAIEGGLWSVRRFGSSRLSISTPRRPGD